MIGLGRQRRFSLGAIDVAIGLSRRRAPGLPARASDAGQPWEIPGLLSHPDGYLRHRRLSAAIRADFAGGTVLDVGDPFCQLARWLPGFTVAATDVIGPIEPSEHQAAFIRADFLNAETIFAAGSYDVVASTDVLEHVAHFDRARFLGECARVAGQACYVAFPAGAQARFAEELVRRSPSRNLFPESLDEHAVTGLPDLAEIEAILCGLELRYDVRIITTVAEWLTSFVFGPEDGDAQLIRDYRSFINRAIGDEAGSGAPYRYLVVIRH